MKRLKTVGVGRGGYTIIETLIVLAASGALVVAVIVLISGQQGKTQFTQAVRDADSRFKDITNDYATGYLPRPNNNISCDPTGGGRPTITSATTLQGRNIGCVYVGRLIRLTPNSPDYKVHGIVGRQYVGDVFSAQTSDLASAKPVLLFPPSSPDFSVSDQFNADIRFQSAVYLDSSNNPQAAGPFGVVTNFGTTSGGSLATDKQTPQLIILTASYASDTDLANKFGAGAGITSSDYVVNRPLALCFESSSSQQHAIITFGSTSGGSISTTTTISGGGTCPAVLF